MCFQSYCPLLLSVILVLLTNIVTTTHAQSFPDSHSGIVVMEFDLSNYSASQEVRLWFPYPVSDRWQLIEDISLEGDYDHAAVYTERQFQTPMVFAIWGKGKHNRHLRFSFKVTRWERKEGALPEKEPCWDKKALDKYLKATSLGPVTGEIAKLAASITGRATTIRDKAKAIYDWICDNMHRDPGVVGCGSGDVCMVLSRKGGKCVDLHSVFVALARAAGVPAREVFGIRQGKTSRTDITGWYHCWAEYYQPGYGWVVVDPADVTKAMLEKGLDKNAPQIKELRKYFWKSVDPYRIRLSYGRDVTLTPKQHGGPLNYLMYPFAQVGKKTLDWLRPKDFSYSVTWYPVKDANTVSHAQGN